MLLCDQKRCRKAYHGSCLSPPLDAAALVGRFVGPCCLPGLWSQLAVSVAASAAAAAAAAASTTSPARRVRVAPVHVATPSPAAADGVVNVCRTALVPTTTSALTSSSAVVSHTAAAPPRAAQADQRHTVLLPQATKVSSSSTGSTDAAGDDTDNRWLDDRRSQGPAQVQLLPAGTPHCRP